MGKRILLSLLGLILLFVFVGCTTEKYGLGVDKSAPEVKVKDIFLKEELFGKPVTLTGKIVSQCGSNGCWFVLQDDTGQVFINLAPGNITLPPRMNMTARVTGTINVVQGQLQVFARGVELK